jgi:hypothetical protein
MCSSYANTEYSSRTPPECASLYATYIYYVVFGQLHAVKWPQPFDGNILKQRIASHHTNNRNTSVTKTPPITQIIATHLSQKHSLELADIRRCHKQCILKVLLT